MHAFRHIWYRGIYDRTQILQNWGIAFDHPKITIFTFKFNMNLFWQKLWFGPNQDIIYGMYQLFDR